MGGWMTYQRMRERNGLRKTGADTYASLNIRLTEDLDRMERDYLDCEYPKPPFASRPPGSDPVAEVAARTGVATEDVRAVLHFVFREQR